MSRAVLHADDHNERDPLAACGAILLRADSGGRAVTLFERARIRRLAREHEARAGESLLASAKRIADTAVDGVIFDADARGQLRLALDVLDVIGG